MPRPALGSGLAPTLPFSDLFRLQNHLPTRPYVAACFQVEPFGSQGSPTQESDLCPLRLLHWQVGSFPLFLSSSLLTQAAGTTLLGLHGEC